jgi:hypothetical protein
MNARCSELVKSIGNLIRQNTEIQELFNSDRAEIEAQIAAIPRKQLELKMDAARRLCDLTVTYLKVGIARKRETLSEVESQQEQLEAFVSSLRGRT